MQSLTLFAMAACGAAQVPVSNPNATIQTCSDLDTCDLTDTQSICQVNSRPISGVGIVPSIIDLGGNDRSATNDDRNLSLTLVDNGLEGGRNLQGFDQFSWKTLYIGSPPSVNLTEGPTGCALMMQYYQQTFPLFPTEDGGFSGVEKTDTACPLEFLPNCVANQLEDSLRTFNYSGQDTERLPRCKALAQHVETTLHNNPTEPFCSYTRGLMTVSPWSPVLANNLTIFLGRYTVEPSQGPMCREKLPQYPTRERTTMDADQSSRKATRYTL